MAAVKVRRVVAAGITPGLGVYASRIQRSAVLSLFICILALTLNAIALASVLPVMMQALETGDLSSLYEAYNLPQGSDSVAGSDSAGSGSSAWG